MIWTYLALRALNRAVNKVVYTDVHVPAKDFYRPQKVEYSPEAQIALLAAQEALESAHRFLNEQRSKS